MRAFLRGFVHAGRGIAAGASGRNFRVMLVAACGAGALAWWLEVGAVRAALVVACMGLVLALELVNTAGEMLVDVLCPDHDPRYGRVKDVLAGAVLVAAAVAAVVGLLVLGPPLWARLVG
jgi:diacylglycerol kinase